jgi:uncharacterized protein YndB with AHSA1/START domain
MKKVLLYGVAVVAVLVLGFVAVVAMQPSTFHIERSATMAAPPEEVFEQVNDFHHWDKWSPWLELDPNAKVTFEGPDSGEGAIFRWAGNENVGEGSMTILESRPSELVRIKLHFLKPFEDTATTDLTMTPEGDGTKVTWTMDGEHNFMSKAMCLFMDMDAMIGGNYETGLANMKKIVEAEPESMATAAETPAEPERPEATTTTAEPTEPMP